MENEKYVEELVRKARAAQKSFEGASQAQADAAARAIARAVFDNAEPLARMAVNETRMGVYEDKVKKNQGKARIIWNDMKGGKSVGVLRELPELGLIEFAKPMGVVGAITPTTNPIVTPMCNAMFAVKGGNAILICPHPRAKKSSSEAVRLMKEALRPLGIPEDLVQIIEEPSVERSSLVMKLCDVCISTGGMGMVRVAYASGKPAFGVGTGNVQCIVDEGVDYEKAVPMIIEGRRFDNGIICSAEQTAILPAKDYETIVALFRRNGAFYVEDPERVAKLRETLFPDGVMNKDLVGQSAAFVAGRVGFEVPEDTKALLVKADGYGNGNLYAKEKMCPVLAAYAYDTWEQAVDIALANLLVEGAGHSACLHSHHPEHIRYAAAKLPVSRLLLNQICATSNGGSFLNALSPTTTLGCGSWGNNSISENLSWRHLFNISRIADIRPGSRLLTDEEVWG